MLPDFEKDELQFPPPLGGGRGGRGGTLNGERTLYTSRQFRRRPKIKDLGHLILYDFGEVRVGALHPRHEETQPEVYRAPEIIMQTGRWFHGVDIWNIGYLVSPYPMVLYIEQTHQTHPGYTQRII
jgi:hypothetical protein